LYGYNEHDDKTIYVDSEKAKDIIEIFETYATGNYSIDTLAVELKKRHTIDKYSLYGRARIAFILSNESYYGNTEYPTIVSKELFERCREIRKSNNTKSKKTKESDALCKRIIYDANGNHLTFIMYGEERYVNTKTTAPTIKKEAVDMPIWELAKVLHKIYIDNKEGIRKKLEKDIMLLHEQREIAIKNKKRLAITIDNIEERLVFGKISKAKAEQLEAKANEDIKSIDKQLKDIVDKILQTKSMIKQTYEESGADYETMTYEQKVDLIRQVIDKIVVTKPSKRKATLTVYPKVSKVKYYLHVDIYSLRYEMSTKFI
jgi:hypothetical protein